MTKFNEIQRAILEVMEIEIDETMYAGGIMSDRVLALISNAVLQVLRNPSKAMLRAAARSMSPERRPTPDRVSVAEKHKIRFQAMIDAIVAEHDNQKKEPEK